MNTIGYYLNCNWFDIKFLSFYFNNKLKSILKCTATLIWGRLVKTSFSGGGHLYNTIKEEARNSWIRLLTIYHCLVYRKTSQSHTYLDATCWITKWILKWRNHDFNFDIFPLETTFYFVFWKMSFKKSNTKCSN